MAGKLAVVDYRKCDPQECGGGACAAVLACPRKLLRQEDVNEPPMTGTSPCRACEDCARACPLGAIRMVAG
jgi:Fe-S-cluster-containing hydrogenase component 2